MRTTEKLALLEGACRDALEVTGGSQFWNGGTFRFLARMEWAVDDKTHTHRPVEPGGDPCVCGEDIRHKCHTRMEAPS